MAERLTIESRQYRTPMLDPEKYKRIIYDPGIVTRIILNRPRNLNASSHALLAELEDAFDRAAADTGCHVVVLSGAGTSFCSGDDTIGLTPESAPTLWDGNARSPEELLKHYGSEDGVWHQFNIEHDHMIGGPLIHKLNTVPKPTIAMVHGYAVYMGFNLAMALDVIFASEDALLLSGGPHPSLIWTLGPRKTLEILYEHRFLTAREALEYHLINRVFPNFEALEKETMAFAYRVAFESTLRVCRAKEAVLNALDVFGYSTAEELARQPFWFTWRQWAEEGHRMRYEGKAIARTPVALANLKAKLESEGKVVPEHVAKALSKSAERDDRATWQRALHGPWRRDPRRLQRAEASAKAYQEWKAQFDKTVNAERERRGL